ncbi:type II toxin-antitoxin system RelE/ParE family toxin [Leucobacter insecticola]|uniref:Type II toxin-antitoxin system RelE/ParE family toxin n=1 Tax=Leucobacter insecticola TaxID=2714934 RepID=A0A6G8FK86_9MICO|nr:type II toxin-antitoxin system RelE/ParE family toxin [Leucobacter insecticola]QIM16764.1 type II toxin-antitoxin system RelE/ParE family toxin [Leucobacter insecticola]
MRLLWSAEARADRIAIWDYLAAENPAAAIRVDQAFADALEHLCGNPLLGRPGLVRGTRDLFPVGHYRIVYEVVDDTISVLAITHTSRLWPAQ